MLYAAKLAVVVLAATAAAAVSSVHAGTPDQPVPHPDPSLGVVSPPEMASITSSPPTSPSIPDTPSPPIGMRRMLNYGYPHPSAPATAPSASPPVTPPGSERLVHGLPIGAPHVRRVLPSSAFDELDKHAVPHGGMARVPRPNNIPKKRYGPSVLSQAAVPSVTPPVTPPGPVPRPNGPAAPAMIDGWVF